METHDKMVSKSYSIRMPESVWDKLKGIADKKMNSTGKYVPVAHVLRDALEYGMPVVDMEISHAVALPLHVKTNTLRMVEFAKSVVAAAAAHGIDQVPGEAA